MSQDVQFKQQLEALKNQGGDVDADAEHEPETARQASNAGLRREAAVQRKGGGGAEGDVQNAAARGVQGGGGQLPHMDAIQRSFGEHDVSGIQAHTGGEAAEASREMGAEAYATGNKVAFAGAPDLHTAAHEAAHVVQQRQGVQLKSKVGAAGDEYEKQADEVADRVVAGKPAGDLLGDAKASAAPAEAGPVQMKGGPKEEKEAPKEATKEEKGKAAHTSDADSRAALSKSIVLLAKHMHMNLAKIQEAMATPDGERTDGGVDDVLTTFDSVVDEVSHVRQLIAAAKIPNEEKGFLFNDLLTLDGAREMFTQQLGKMTTYVAKAQAKLPKDSFDKAIEGLFAAAGEHTGRDQRIRSEPAASDSSLQTEAINAHIKAAIDATNSAAMGNPQVERIALHIREIHDLAPSKAHGMKVHQAELKHLLALVTALESSHPGVTDTLRQALALLKALNSLAQ
ncbi:hypothetical protein BH11MYX3_BH11MYX3_27440 [soil metagenome]